MLKECTNVVIWKPINASKPVFYDLIDKIWNHKESPNRPLHRICSLFRKMNVGTVYIEELDFRKSDKVYQEFELIKEKLQNSSLTAKLYRLSAFHKRIGSNPAEDNYLGYAAVLNIMDADTPIRSYIIDSVIRIPMIFPGNTQLNKDIPNFKKAMPVLNNYYHCTHNYTGYVDSTPFNINGLLFCQQNQITTVCAHACLRMAINNLPYLEESELITTTDILMESKRINGGNSPEYIHIDHFLKIINGLGFNHTMDDTVLEKINYDAIAYPLMESGLPTILEITTKDPKTTHVITVVGHTLNSDLWHPEAETGYSIPDWIGHPHIQASSLTDQYIIMDDQMGPALCLSMNTLGKKPSFKCRRITGISRYPINVKPYVVEEKASAYYYAGLDAIDENSKWIKRLKASYPIFRNYILDKESYTRHMKNVVFKKMEVKKEIDEIISKVPDYFWFFEFSLTDLYTANKNKLGEILINKDTNEPILMRYVSNLLYNNLGKNHWEKYIIENITEHSPLLRSKLEIPCWEW